MPSTPSNAHTAQHPHIPLFTSLATYFGYGLLIFFGYVRDFLDILLGTESAPCPKGYAPLVSDFEDFYIRRLFYRIHDCFDRPVGSCPGAHIDVYQRINHGYRKPLETTDKLIRCTNLGSYNYLGFGDPNSTTKPSVFAALDKFSVATCSTRMALGTTTLHKELESVVARFVGKQDAMVFGMGFGTNSTGVPALIGKGGLIISDAMNHSSIAVGARSSGAVIKVFKHNDPEHLEMVIRKAIIDGQPRSHRPWTKILIVVEGIYSMEGEMPPLAEIVAVKKKYGCYLYVDEAHSIGAVGPNGRGICDHAGVSPDDVDILMGTFTKSFGAVGGYIAGSKEMINYMRVVCAGSVYSPSISPPACQQIISAMKIIMGEDGTDIGRTKLRSLRDNANYFRKRMTEMGCHVLGTYDSPVVPVMLYNPAKIPAFSRECLARGLAVVVVGFPASPLLLSRVRFCISAAHTRADLEDAIAKLDQVVNAVGIRYARPFHFLSWKALNS